jgi:hypothetical protein
MASQLLLRSEQECGPCRLVLQLSLFRPGVAVAVVAVATMVEMALVGMVVRVVQI